LADCYAGRPRHPVFVALARTVERHTIPAKPFHDLIDAFKQDQTVTRYPDWAQLIDYCRRSADPVGRIVLHMGCGGAPEARLLQLSDATCTALQLVNFWQDVRRDIQERDRIYVPADALAEQGLTHQDLLDHVRGAATLDAPRMKRYQDVMRSLMRRTWPLFERGRELPPLAPRDIRLPVRLFGMGGEAVMRAIEAIDGATLDRRPRLSKATKAWLMIRAWIESAFTRSRA
jgi:squalene synthase HpnC